MDRDTWTVTRGWRVTLRAAWQVQPDPQADEAARGQARKGGAPLHRRVEARAGLGLPRLRRRGTHIPPATPLRVRTPNSATPHNETPLLRGPFPRCVDRSWRTSSLAASTDRTPARMRPFTAPAATLRATRPTRRATPTRRPTRRWACNQSPCTSLDLSLSHPHPSLAFAFASRVLLPRASSTSSSAASPSAPTARLTTGTPERSRPCATTRGA